MVAVLVLLLSIVLCSLVAQAITKQEIMTLAQLGISDDEIIEAIEKDRTVFRLGINDILELKNAGVPESVIRFMLATPQKFGVAIDEEPSDEPAPVPAVHEKTPEEIRAEAERARLEALRLKQEQDKAHRAQRRAYAEGELKKGMEMAEGGEWVEAVRHFRKFVSDGDFPPDSDEYYNAQYGIALALVKAKLYRTAADVLLEIVLQGPEKPFFQPAFSHLREVRKKIEFSPPDLEQLTHYHVSSFSQPFQDSYNYFLGQFFYEYDNYSLALKYFELVSRSSSEYTKTLYVTGIIQAANQMYKSATQSWQQLLAICEEEQCDARVAYNALLALARIAYETGDYDLAIAYYRNIPEEPPRVEDTYMGFAGALYRHLAKVEHSSQYAEAQYERMWTYFMKGDYNRFMLVMRKLGFRNSVNKTPGDGKEVSINWPRFWPEVRILQATAFLNTCHWERARMAVGAFRDEVLVHAAPLREFMQSMRTPAEYFMAVEAITSGDQSYGLEKEVLYEVLADVDFRSLARTIGQIRWEQEQFQAARPRLCGLAACRLEVSDWLAERQAVLESDRVARTNENGIKTQQLLRTLQSRMQDYEVRTTEIELDLNLVEMEKIEAQTRELLLQEQIDRAVQTVTALTNEDSPLETILERVEGDAVFAKFEQEHVRELEKAGVRREVLRAIQRRRNKEPPPCGNPTSLAYLLGKVSVREPYVVPLELRLTGPSSAAKTDTARDQRKKVPIGPPSLSLEMEFSEPSGNDVLDAGEEASLRLTVQNEGPGEAKDVVVRLEELADIDGLDFDDKFNVGDLAAGGDWTTDITIEADEDDLEDGRPRIRATATEDDGFDADATVLSFATMKFQPPALVVERPVIDDSAGDGNGRVKAGEMIALILPLANRGTGPAREVSVTIEAGTGVFLAEEDRKQFSTDVGELPPGKSRDVVLRFYTNKRIDQVELELAVNESRSPYSFTGKLNFPIEKPGQRPGEIAIAPQHDLPAAPASGNGGSAHRAPPPTVTPEPVEREFKEPVKKRWAVVIGVSKYEDDRIEQLRYAARDAEAFHEWLTSCSGYGGCYPLEQVKVLLNEDASFGNIRDAVFDFLTWPLEEDLVTIYFSGHGSPASPEAPDKLYLLPWDADYDKIGSTAFPMYWFNDAIKRKDIKARRVLMVIDACHAGGVGSEFEYARKGMAVKPRVNKGAHRLSRAADGVVVLTSSGAGEVEFSQEHEKWGGGHGVFTWALLEGLKGEADDKPKDNQVTVWELVKFVVEKVRRETRGHQAPRVSGSVDPTMTISH